MRIPGALPAALRVWWVSASPLAFLFAGRILLAKTIWTWSRRPQMVGFAHWHIHPGFAVAGMLCSFAVALWLLIAIPYAMVRRRDIEPWDWLKMAASVMVVLTLGLFLFERASPADRDYVLREQERPTPKIFLVGCKVNSGSESAIAAWSFHAQQLSTEPTTWEGAPGAAVTIRFEAGPKQLEQLEGLQIVSFNVFYSHGFEAPVMKLEPQALTVFFKNDATHYVALREVCEELKAGTLGVGGVLR